MANSNVIVKCDASLTSSNIASGQPWAKALPGHVKVIRAVGFVPYGTDIAALADAFDGTYTFNVKIDNQDIVFESYPTASIARDGTEVGDGQISGLFRGSLMPMNSVLEPGQELNVYVTTPANGESLFILIAEDIPIQG